MTGHKPSNAQPTLLAICCRSPVAVPTATSILADTPPSARKSGNQAPAQPGLFFSKLKAAVPGAINNPGCAGHHSGSCERPSSSHPVSSASLRGRGWQNPAEISEQGWTTSSFPTAHCLHCILAKPTIRRHQHHAFACDLGRSACGRRGAALMLDKSVPYLL